LVTVSRGPSSTTTTLDGFGWAIGTVNAVGVHTATAYDTDGRKTQQSYPFTTNDLGADTFQYDGLGRLTRVSHPDNSYLERVYSGADISVTVSLTRFRGHLPKGGYEVRYGITQGRRPAAAATVL
jgi:hypothetical protein